MPMWKRKEIQEMLRRHIVLLKLLAAISTGVLLACSFPPLEWYGAAWFALVPLLILVRYCGALEAFKWGLLSGTIFWGLSLAWLRCLAVSARGIVTESDILTAFMAGGAWLFLVLYCALYVAVFAAVAAGWLRCWGTGDWRKSVAYTVAMPLVWVGLEYVRSTIFTGFPWNTLGVSQYINLAICQLAGWGGVYAVSGLLVLFNVGLTMTIVRYRGVAIGARYRAHPELMIALLAFSLTFVYGARRVLKHVPPPVTLDIAVVQPNIEQTKKWDEEWQETIRERLRVNTMLGGFPRKDLVIWPETAVPAYAQEDPDYYLIQCLLTNSAPILAGSMFFESNSAGEITALYNSAMLFEPGQRAIQKYDKQHLVVFGEYLPFENMIPALKRLSKNWSCTPGKGNVVFRLLARPEVAFSCLICFEDTLASLARRAVRGGARLLVNQTNDGWFDVSSCPRQHLAHCVFRCIENRVPAVRATNTGMTCVIDSTGRIQDRIPPLSEGVLMSRVQLPAADMELTFYTLHGDVFAVLSLCIGVAIVGMLIRSKVASQRAVIRQE